MTAIPKSNAIFVVELRVEKLEKDMSELKTVDHSSKVLDILQSQVPIVVDSYLDTKVRDMVSALKNPLTFNDLMATLIDISKYMLNGLKIENLPQEIMLGPAFNLLKGHQTVVADYFFNNDLEYLKNSDPESTIKHMYNKYALMGIKHWGERRKLWYRSQVSKFSKQNVYSTKAILGVKSVSVKKLHGYGHLEEIVLKRSYQRLYKFKEGPFQMETVWEPLAEGTGGAPHQNNVKMLLEGSELTKEDRESHLYDDFEHFQQHKGETIHGYYVWFAKLINDMRNIKMTMSRMQLNSKVMVQNVQGRHNGDQGTNPWGGGAAGYGRVQNRVGNANPGQVRQVKCYNCKGIGHIAMNCTQSKRSQNSDYYKDKMLLMQAQENEVALDDEHVLFLAGGQDNAIDEDVDEKPVQDLALNVDNVFQADDCDTFDSDVDEAPMAQTMFMAILSTADPVYD
nr:retrovirus-related Pol polyprotein from transposon TNT 1-94 [Tanacetum cinerariifolium]